MRLVLGQIDGCFGCMEMLWIIGMQRAFARFLVFARLTDLILSVIRRGMEEMENQTMRAHL